MSGDTSPLGSLGEWELDLGLAVEDKDGLEDPDEVKASKEPRELVLE